MVSGQSQRVICYVDGFNLYYGLKHGKLQRLYWLDIHNLARNLLRPHQQIQSTKYFTARINGAHPGDSPRMAKFREEKRRRQAAYLEALETVDHLKIYEGHFLSKELTCRKCGSVRVCPEEKMTDVYIATELMADAFLGNFDMALVVSGDSDLVPPIKAIRSHFKEKRIIIAFPPNRQSANLKKEASGYFTINQATLKASQLPQQVVKADGTILERPSHWT